MGQFKLSDRGSPPGRFVPPQGRVRAVAERRAHGGVASRRRPPAQINQRAALLRGLWTVEAGP